MPIENWSEQVILVKLGNDPQLSDDLQTVTEMVAAKPANVVVDLSAVKFINSSHIGRLLRLRQTMLESGRRLVLCGADAQVWSVFIVMGLDKIYNFADTVPTALATVQIQSQPGPA